MYEYSQKNSTHPFRVADSNSWVVTRPYDKSIAHIALVVYNAYLAALGLALVGYSGYLINKDNTPFAKILMIVGSWLCATALVYFVFPYLYSSKVNSAIWFAMNAALFCFTLACCVMSFLPTLADEVIKLDVNNNTKRRNAGIFFVDNKAFMNAATILGSIFTLIGMGAFGYLWLTWKDYVHPQKAGVGFGTRNDARIDLNNVDQTNRIANNNQRMKNNAVPTHGAIEIQPEYQY